MFLRRTMRQWSSRKFLLSTSFIPWLWTTQRILAPLEGDNGRHQNAVVHLWKRMDESGMHYRCCCWRHARTSLCHRGQMPQSNLPSQQTLDDNSDFPLLHRSETAGLKHVVVMSAFQFTNSSWHDLFSGLVAWGSVERNLPVYIQQ